MSRAQLAKAFMDGGPWPFPGKGTSPVTVDNPHR